MTVALYSERLSLRPEHWSIIGVKLTSLNSIGSLIQYQRLKLVVNARITI